MSKAYPTTQHNPITPQQVHANGAFKNSAVRNLHNCYVAVLLYEYSFGRLESGQDVGHFFLYRIIPLMAVHLACLAREVIMLQESESVGAAQAVRTVFCKNQA